MKEWEIFLQRQEKIFGKSTIDQWLRTLTIHKFDACNLYLQAKDFFQINWFEEHIRNIAKNEFFNANGRLIKIHLQTVLDKTAAHEKQEPFFPFDKLDTSSTFDNFIVSKENESTLGILRKVLLNLATHKSVITPIYLHGPSGSGKTHLMIGFAKLCQTYNYRVYYVKAETFSAHVVSAIRLGKMKEFRTLYRLVDILLIDNIHYISGKISTEEELFHTFNELHNRQKLIVFSSHIPPYLLQDMEDRLISRLEWGLLLHINSLSGEDLHILAKQNCKNLFLNIDDAGTRFLCEQFPNAYFLTLACNAVALRLSNAIGSPISVDTVRQITKDLIHKQKMCCIDYHKILSEVSRFYEIPKKDIIGKSQEKECLIPRQVAMYLCRDILQLTYPQIGRVFSRDHTTVMASIKRIQQETSSFLQPISSIKKYLFLIEK
ncbi:MAG: DnaA ATPase domain-containing protein [Chlamydiales bacterium]